MIQEYGLHAALTKPVHAEKWAATAGNGPARRVWAESPMKTNGITELERSARANGSVDYKCACCGRALAALDATCACGNAVGVLDQ